MGVFKPVAAAAEKIRVMFWRRLSTKNAMPMVNQTKGREITSGRGCWVMMLSLAEKKEVQAAYISRSRQCFDRKKTVRSNMGNENLIYNL